MKHTILIVEDDASFGVMLQTWLKKNNYEVVLATQYAQAKREITSKPFDLILTDLRLPDGDGIMLMAWVREQFKSRVPFIVMTGYAEVQTAVSAMKLGAFDYLKKPINPSVLEEKIMAALESGQESEELFRPKEYIAEMIHESSPRHDKPFIAVDCGSLSKELAPSELFGHLKGSFTSAIADKKGVFEQAKGGTVFLDEVGNLPYEVQMQLLRSLQEQKVRPVGSAIDIPVDVRIVAATNENIEKAIEQGKFRQDLYHRINEFTLQVPPLRDRLEDLEEFAAFFLSQANEELGKEIKGISPKAVAAMKQMSWNGNLRELRNVIRRCVLFAEGDYIEVEDLPVYFDTPNPTKTVSNEDYALRPGNEREQIEAALAKARGNKTVAARLLQVDRKTLYNKMHQLGLLQ